jgi:hypothetical protein
LATTAQTVPVFLTGSPKGVGNPMDHQAKILAQSLKFKAEITLSKQFWD